MFESLVNRGSNSMEIQMWIVSDVVTIMESWSRNIKGEKYRAILGRPFKNHTLIWLVTILQIRFGTWIKNRFRSLINKRTIGIDICIWFVGDGSMVMGTWSRIIDEKHREKCWGRVLEAWSWLRLMMCCRLSLGPGSKLCSEALSTEAAALWRFICGFLVMLQPRFKLDWEPLYDKNKDTYCEIGLKAWSWLGLVLYCRSSLESGLKLGLVPL